MTETSRSSERRAPTRRGTETSRCATPGCIKYHDFFQWNGKYYCLECYEALRIHAAQAAVAG
ncbi:MAG: hypothetical protein KatS3mg102_2261 [Planctomycetota bacterium]|nr:MAG: hypothetical protein KatS3mg102_2261 [Planctomycetota bacterium]